MKIVKANNKTTVSMTKKEWIEIGKHFKTAQAPPGFGSAPSTAGNPRMNNVPAPAQITNNNQSQMEASTSRVRSLEKQKNELYKTKGKKEAELALLTTEQQKTTKQNEINSLTAQMASIDNQIWRIKFPAGA